MNSIDHLNEGIPDVPTPANALVGEGPERQNNENAVERGREAFPAIRAASPAISSNAAGNAQSLEKLFQRMNVLSKEGKWTDLASVIRNHEELMIKRCGDLEQFILTCDPIKHSAAVIFALNVLYDIAEKKSLSSGQERVFDILRNFFISKTYGREQLLSIVDIYCQLFRKLHDYCISTKKYEIGLNVTILGIDAITDTGSGLLTSLHSHLFDLALQADQPGQACGYLEDIKDILNENMISQHISSNYSTNSPHIEYKYVLSYLYYGSEIAYKNKDVNRAIVLLHNLITFPATDIVPMLVTGHKKWFLYQILADKDVTPPAGRSPCLNRVWRQECEPYMKIYNAMQSKENTLAAVNAVLKEHEKVFEKDETTDLINALLVALTERAVLKVAKCFSNIGIQDLVRRAYLKSVEEAKELCEKLSQEGKLTARFENDVVHLQIPAHKVSESAIKKTLQRVEAAKQNLTTVHCSVQCHPIYLSRTLRVSGPGYLDDEGLSMSMAHSQALQKD
ncbi:unnamed protein product, partial [Mesorhabditis belari]|uniref:COP9 signalosome complex subunit 3 N-terminal helical repeats domain-containing protein n=1 Tax=Mesorhabditis belari TaxID=2138241 RepID=A0AAF3FEN8_9BILA